MAEITCHVGYSRIGGAAEDQTEACPGNNGASSSLLVISWEVFFPLSPCDATSESSRDRKRSTDSNFCTRDAWYASLAGAYHAGDPSGPLEHNLLGGCALAIADKEDINQVGMDDLVRWARAQVLLEWKS